MFTIDKEIRSEHVHVHPELAPSYSYTRDVAYGVCRASGRETLSEIMHACELHADFLRTSLETLDAELAAARLRLSDKLTLRDAAHALALIARRKLPWWRRALTQPSLDDFDSDDLVQARAEVAKLEKLSKTGQQELAEVNSLLEELDERKINLDYYVLTREAKNEYPFLYTLMSMNRDYS